MNLAPLKFRSAFGTPRSDGLQLVDLLRTPAEQIAKGVRDSAPVEGRMAFHCGDTERAHAALTPLLATGEPGVSRELATAAPVESGRLSEAVPLARRCLDAADTPADARAMRMNNLACALLKAGAAEARAANLTEADELSVRAMEVLPIVNAVRATRGAVLVELGRYLEAAQLLDDKRFRIELPHNRATVLVSLAPDHPHFVRARERLAARTAGAAGSRAWRVAGAGGRRRAGRQ